MKYTLKAIIFKNLERLEDYLVKMPLLIPRPKEILGLEKNQGVILSSKCIVSFINVDNKQMFLNNFNEELIQLTTIHLKEQESNENDNRILEEKDVWAILDVNNKEAYNLEIENNRIIIYGIYENGLFYGLQTLLQLIKNSFLSKEPSKKKEKLIIPELSIKDVPDLKVRGVAQDISRGQVFTPENARRFIDILSHYKMNTYCLYIEDMFAHPNHPEIGKNRGALTAKEIKELDAYAKKRFINLIPIFECLGHVDNILMHKKYEQLGEFPGAQCLDISNPEVISFLNEYITEISKNFSSRYFHIGCDESFDLGRYKSSKYIEEIGRSKAITDYYNKLYKTVRKAGKKFVIMYDDILRNDDYIQKNLNKDMILMFWYYGKSKKEKSIKKLIDAGFRVILSPSMMNWQRNFPDNFTSNCNIINFANTAYKYRDYGCKGVLTSTWGDQRYYSLRENEIYGAVLTGAITWNVKAFDLIEMRKKFGFLFYGIQNEHLEEFLELFTLLSSSADYYYRFVKLLPPFFFIYLFKHPFSQIVYKAPGIKHKKLGKLAENCIALYNSLKTQVNFENENFELLEFSAILALTLRDKIALSKKVSEVLNSKEIIPEDVKALIPNLKEFKNRLEDLKNSYEKFWLRAAKRPCLDVILNLFDFLIKCYADKINQLKEEPYFVDPYLPSEWIWAKEEKCPREPRYFRNIIEITQPIQKAVIEGIACEYMKIYVNGSFVGEVLSRMSLSILPIINRVKIFNITKYLKKGKNVIAVEGYNYDGYKGAINLYGQIQLKDNSIQEILTNRAWKCQSKKKYNNSDWSKLEFDDSQWRPIKTYGRPPNLNGDLFKTDILNGEITITQDYFGLESYTHGSIDTIIGGIFGTVAKKISPKLIKVLQPYG
ncbi:MAG: family 20 glycosylhydrolase [Promethearchaeota archaeon]